MVIFVLQTRWGMNMTKKLGNRFERYTSKLFGRPPPRSPWQTAGKHSGLKERSCTATGNEGFDEGRGERKRPGLRDRSTKSGSSATFPTGSGANRVEPRHGLLLHHQIRGRGPWTVTGWVRRFVVSMLCKDRWRWLIWWRKNKENTKNPAAEDVAGAEQV